MSNLNISWGHLEELTKHVAEQIEIDVPEDKASVVLCGIPSGGVTAAYAIARHLSLPTHVTSVGNEGDAEWVVMVDDILDSGETLRKHTPWFRHDAVAVLVANADTQDNIETDAPVYVGVRRRSSGWVKFPWESEQAPESSVRRILQFAGDDPNRDGLVETPRRFLNFLNEWHTVSDSPVEMKLFPSDSTDLVVVKDIPFFSLCEHHLLPYHGVMHVGYLPNGHVVGLSKIPRLVRKLSSRFTIQEDLTQRVARSLADALHTENVAVVSEATHTCSMIRGVRVSGMGMQSSAMFGEFREAALRSEFLSLTRH